VDENSIGRRHMSRRQKGPCGAFLDARLATSTRAHQELQRREDAGVFLLSETFQSISKGGFEQQRSRLHTKNSRRTESSMRRLFSFC
jgi:hypothetical protein